MKVLLTILFAAINFGCFAQSVTFTGSYSVDKQLTVTASDLKNKAALIAGDSTVTLTKTIERDGSHIYKITPVKKNYGDVLVFGGKGSNGTPEFFPLDTSVSGKLFIRKHDPPDTESFIDTVKVILICIDTTAMDIGGRFVRMVRNFTVYSTYTSWIYGYEIKGPDLPDDFSISGSGDEFNKITEYIMRMPRTKHIKYLTTDKKAMPKGIVVIQSIKLN